MRRLRNLILTLAILGLALVPSALALKIDPAPPPAGFVGVPYNFLFKPEAGQGCSPYTFKFLAGALPSGLSISSGGTMSGTPTTVGDYTFYVEMASCQGNLTQRQFTVKITERFVIDSSPLPDASINAPYTANLVAKGGTPTGWSLVSGALPAGVTLSPTGVVSGTPTASGEFNFRVRATSANGTDETSFKLFVSAPLVLTGPKVDAKEPLSLNWKVGSIVNWGVKANGGKGPYAFTSTTLPTGITLNPDGSIVGEAGQAGTTKVTFTVTDVNGATDTLEVSITFKALLTFSTTARPPVGKVGKLFRWKLPVTGASKTKLFLASGKFPPGLELDEATGMLSGTPLQPGGYRVKFWVFGDPGTQLFKSYTIRINA